MNNMDQNSLNDEERQQFEQELSEKLLALKNCPDTEVLQGLRLQLDIAEILNWLSRTSQAWTMARVAFATALSLEAWQDAAEACNVLYQTKEQDYIAALGMGVWLAVTFPVTPQLTFAMLDHVVTESPGDAYSAALAAVTARYVIDLRASDAEHGDWSLLANDLIGRVALRHADVQDQAALNIWMDQMGLRDPQSFLPRLSQVVNDMVGELWWFDRNELRDRLPD
jgi:hypothetical protein